MPQLKQFAKYEIVRKLSRSLTDVYLARDPDAGRLVVLKLIEQTRDESTQVLIEAERRGAALQKQLHQTDARILDVYEFGEHQNCFFVVLEYFEGQTLAEVVRRERTLDATRAARYAAEISDQLKTLHSFVLAVDGRQTAVVHGDIKPSNVQIGSNEEVRLLDFGIAKVISLTHNLTYQNFGSPSYCSPERLSKGQMDAHSDLWALGVSLYEMISGVPPYQAQNTRKLENLIQSRRPLRALPETCPGGLKAIVEKALAARAEERYQSTVEFGDDLRAFLEGRVTAAETETRSPWNAAPTVARQPLGLRATRLATKTRTLMRLRPDSPVLVRGDMRQAGLALLIGLLFGLLVLMPAGYFYRFHQASEALRAQTDFVHGDVDAGWDLYKDLDKQNEFLGSYSPAIGLRAPMRAKLLNAADSVIGSFHANPLRPLSDFDWAKAELCLRHAVELNPADTKAQGKLALCRGYANLARNPNLPKAGLSLNEFRQAERLLPDSADPHVGLARLYVYSYRNVTPAMAELRAAERLGFRAGPREAREEADGYLFRAEWELVRARYTVPDTAKRKWTAMARADLERARKLYLPIAGVDGVERNLQRLNTAQRESVALEAKPVRRRLLPVKRRTIRHQLSASRWQ